MGYTRLGDMLVGENIISNEQLEQALALQQETGLRLGEVLQNVGAVTEKELISVLTVQLGVDYIDLNTARIDPRMAELMPKEAAMKYRVVPLRLDGSSLYLAMADPMDFNAMEDVRAITRKKIIPMIAAGAAVDRAVRNLYANQGAESAIKDMQGAGGGSSPELLGIGTIQMLVLDDMNDAAPAVKLVNSIIDRAVTENASDIHMEPEENGMAVRLRVDGVLRTVLNIPKEMQGPVVSRIKIMGRLDIAKKSLPQDGRSKVLIRNETLDLRISTLPTVHGEAVVIRLLRVTSELSTFDGVGMRGHNKEVFTRLIRDSSEGVILIVGPTGSGKTSTLYAVIRSLKGPDVNLIALEDPVEYNMDGVRQVPINEKTGLTFASALRSVLRQDPDIIAVGEIRDGETAEIAMRSAMTGHKVFSTIHTNSAVSSIDRLLDIGIEPYLITGAVKAILSQRLLRKTCPHCSTRYEPTDEELRMMGMEREPGLKFYKGRGCGECFNTGYKGRTGVFEILTMAPEVRHAIHARSIKQLEQAVLDCNFRGIWEDCRDLVREGITTVAEVQRVMGGAVQY